MDKLPVFIVDEDETQMSSLVTELEIRGYDVQVFPNASEALLFFRGFEGRAKFVILDVMLAGGDGCKDVFRRDNTNDFIETGIVLIRELVKCCPKCFPTKSVFLSHATSASLVKKLTHVSNSYGIHYFRKQDIKSDKTFVDELEKLYLDSDE